MPDFPKQTADKHFPGMGSQYQLGAANLGISLVNHTLALNTALTDAQIIASPPNSVSGHNAGSVVVHSLGTVPSLAFVIPRNSSLAGISYSMVTANNSASYWRASNWTNFGNNGVSVQVVHVR